MELKMVQPWSIHPFYPFLSLALHTSWFGASWWASWAATPSAETFSCQGEKEWKRMKKNHLIWTIYNGFYDFLWTAHHAMNKNIIHEYGWIWVVDRVVHYIEEYLALSYIIMYYLDLSSIKSCGAAMSCFHLLSTSFICFHLLSPNPPSLSLNWQEKSTNNKIIQKSIINHSVSTCKILQVSYHWQWLAEPFCSEFIMPYYMWICKFIG